MNYDLKDIAATQKRTTGKAIRKLLPWLGEERRILLFAFLTIMVTSGINLTGPLLIGYTVDHFVAKGNYQGVVTFCAILLGMYAISFGSNYLQTRLMGGVGQRMLFNLRNSVFKKLQELPVAFFNQNKAGDLISRINNDTDKLNQFFSQSLMQFVSNIFMMFGAGIFLLVIHPRLGAATLLPAVLLFIFTGLLSAYVKKKNAQNLQTVGSMSAEIQESLQNFKVIIAFNRRDYFRKRFETANLQNYSTAIGAGLVNNIFLPVFTFCSQLAQLIVLSYGIYLISHQSLSIGLLISYLAYVGNFYFPIRQLATIWTTFQVAMAGWDRIADILNMEQDTPVADEKIVDDSGAVLSFNKVHFGYPGGKEVLHDVSFQLQPGKTYAFVGPTGGGKSTTAALMSRLYDPLQGSVLLAGKDIKSYSGEERTQKIGFILQDPFLFSGTVKENILYGNTVYKDFSNEALTEVIENAHLGELLLKFETV